MNITSQKCADGWRASASYNGQPVCTVFGYNTKARAERAASQSAKDELRRQHLASLNQQSQRARV